MKKNCFGKALPLLLIILLVASIWQLSLFAAADDSIVLTLIHTNDRHGRMDSSPYVAQLVKDTAGPVLVLDAGDTLHGQIATNLSKGAAMVELMNLVGYTAMVPGNHDFAFGIERLLELSAMMDFPLLCANIKTSDGEDLLSPFEIFLFDGVTVGIFGLTTPETLTKTDPRNVVGLSFADPAETAADMVDVLKSEGCDIIIALVHLGVDDASAEADRSDALAQVPGIDLIIDGHSHTLLEEGLPVGGALLAQTGSFDGNIGVVTLTLSGGEVKKEAKLIAVPGADDEDALAADEAVLNKIAALDAANAGITSQIVGKTPVLLQGEREYVRTGETNLANLITDSMRFATGADAAFLTGGNIRASIEAGDITMGQVLTTLPFSNLLMTVELKGSDLMEVLEHGISLYPEAAGSHIQVSGLSFAFDAGAAPGSRVRSATMADGSALDPEKVYTIATIEFIVAGGDGYSMMLSGKNEIYFQGDAEALADYLATSPEIQGEAEGRVSIVEATDVQPVQPEQPAQPTLPEAPTQPAQPEQPSAFTTYTVKAGDVLWRIARDYGTTWQELQRINNIANADLIFPGQVFNVPVQVNQSAA